MDRKETIKNLFLAMGQILEAGAIVFSRDSLYAKMDRLSGLDRGSRRYLNQATRRSCQQGLIRKKEKGGQVYYELTPSGIKKVKIYQLKELSFDNRGWDGNWRVVIFDIPESQRGSRDKARRLMKSLGFFSLQKSVFVTPYKCEKELDLLGKFFDINEYLETFLTRSFERRREEELRRFFGL
jgi:CRISPR-associated endonuclease Cas2